MDYMKHVAAAEKIQSDPELIRISKRRKTLLRFPQSAKRFRSLHDLTVLETQRKRFIIEQHAFAFDIVYSQTELFTLLETEVPDHEIEFGIDLAPTMPRIGVTK